MMQIRKVMDHDDAKTTVSSHGHATKTLTDVARTKTSFDLGGTSSKSTDDGRSRKVIHTKENRHTLNKKFESLCKKKQNHAIKTFPKRRESKVKVVVPA